jgi:hypothetical protein
VNKRQKTKEKRFNAMAYIKYVHAPHQRMDKDSLLHLKLVHVGLMKFLPKNDATMLKASPVVIIIITS